tara:strand:- start:1627 stop:1845 length:219 start_codon:yes stop_codon:yes gene_type:complete
MTEKISQASRAHHAHMRESALDIEISEDEIHLKGADGLDLKVSGRIPDKWALLLLIAIASMLGLNELGMGGL